MRWIHLSFAVLLGVALVSGCAATGSVPAIQQESTPDWIGLDGVWQEDGYLLTVGYGYGVGYDRGTPVGQGYALELAKKNAREKFTSHASVLAGLPLEKAQVDFSGFEVVRDHCDRPQGRQWGCYVLARIPASAIETE